MIEEHLQENHLLPKNTGKTASAYRSGTEVLGILLTMSCIKFFRAFVVHRGTLVR